MTGILKALPAAARAAARLLWHLVAPALGVAVQILAALVVLFEEWGWRPLSQAFASLARFRPWARIEQTIAGLPPYAALAVIALPSSLLFPLKFVAVYLVANGYILSATALFIAAKIVSTALVGRLFLLVKPQLMQIGWFAALYGRFVPWKDAMFARIRASRVWRYGRMLKTAARIAATRAWASARTTLRYWLARN
jgi:hypothetical protein